VIRVIAPFLYGSATGHVYVRVARVRIVSESRSDSVNCLSTSSRRGAVSPASSTTVLPFIGLFEHETEADSTVAIEINT